MVVVVRQLFSMLIKNSFIPQFVILLDCHALYWIHAFSQVLEVHSNRNLDIVLEYMLVTLHHMQDQWHLFLIHRPDMCHHISCGIQWPFHNCFICGENWVSNSLGSVGQEIMWKRYCRALWACQDMAFSWCWTRRHFAASAKSKCF